MIIRMDKENKLAEVWMSRADQQNPAQKSMRKISTVSAGNSTFLWLPTNPVVEM